MPKLLKFNLTNFIVFVKFVAAAPKFILEHMKRMDHIQNYLIETEKEIKYHIQTYKASDLATYTLIYLLFIFF